MAKQGTRRPSTKERNAEVNRRLTSVNFPNDILEYIDRIADDVDMSRSAVICVILRAYMESNKTLKFVMVENEQEKDA